MSKKRILLVDDDIAFTHAVRLNLLDCGDYDVHVENRSRHALATAQEFCPDVILLDYIMPGVDGGDVSALLKSDAQLRRVPVIMISSLISNNGPCGSRSSDGHIMLGKPIEFAKLRRCIESSLNAAAA